MLFTPGTPITEAALDDLAALANAKLLPLVNAAIAADQNNWRSAAFWNYDAYGNVVSWGGKNIYDRPVAMTSNTTQGILNPQPAYTFSESTANWQAEINRIRGDILEMVLNFNYTGGNNLFLSQNCLVSGPWVVGVNDPVTWPNGDQGILHGSSPSAMCLFKNVAFAFFSEDAPGGFSVTGTMTVPAQSNTYIETVGLPFTLNYAVKADGALSVTVSWAFTGPTGAAPAASAFTTNSATPATHVTWSTSVVSAGNFLLTATFAYTAAYGDTGSILFKVGTPPAGYAFVIVEVGGPGEEVYYYSVGWQGGLQFAESSAQTPVTAISPTKTPVQIALSETGAVHESLVLNSQYAVTNWTLSDVSVPGVWIAKTLPVPGRNVFCDQDMPQFVNFVTNGIGETYLIAASSAQVSQYPNQTPVATSMRCYVDALDSQNNPTIPNFNPVQSARPASPTPYLVRRDTDFVPFTLGFNPNELLNVNSGQAGANGASVFGGSPTVYNTADSLKLRLVAGGTGGKGWRSGVLGYGTALPAAMRVYFSTVGYIDVTNPSTYDFYVDANSIDFPGAAPAGYPGGAAAYWARIMAGGGINYAVQNNTAGTLNIDVVEQLDFGGVAPVRQYFPPYFECWSYSLDGTPSLFPLFAGNYNFNKHIPQAGYSIFKVRATRLPVPNGAGISVTPTTGAAITATVGQNRLQMDGSLLFTPLLDAASNPITVTIPLNQRDSGDVTVFWPVLAGTELVYQCASQIIFEAWVDFQPVFFNLIYGIESGTESPADDPTLQNVATVFQYCMGFANKFSPVLAGYPELFLPGGADKAYPVVHFPPSAEIYNDLWNLLNLI